jgi:hypothetical protein
MILDYMLVYVPFIQHTIIKLCNLCFVTTFGCNYNLKIHDKLLLILLRL